jgi:hypothetical protein
LADKINSLQSVPSLELYEVIVGWF